MDFGNRGDWKERYIPLQVLGKGAFGTARLARKRSRSANLVVIKEIAIARLKPPERQAAFREIQVLQRFSHNNIVKYVDSYQEVSKIFIVMEYADGGDLSERLNQRRARKSDPFFVESYVCHLFSQIVLAIRHIHSQRILHRDLKPQNIFLHGPNDIVKLGDFGVSRILDHTNEMALTQCGTPYFISPEIWSGKQYGPKSDIWSLGCILFELLALKVPFTAANLAGLAIEITQRNPVELPKRVTPKMRNLVTKLLSKDPAARPTANELCQEEIIAYHVNTLFSYTMEQTKQDQEDLLEFQQFALPDQKVPSKKQNEIEQSAPEFAGYNKVKQEQKENTSADRQVKKQDDAYKIYLENKAAALRNKQRLEFDLGFHRPHRLNEDKQKEKVKDAKIDSKLDAQRKLVEEEAYLKALAKARHDAKAEQKRIKAKMNQLEREDRGVFDVQQKEEKSNECPRKVSTPEQRQRERKEEMEQEEQKYLIELARARDEARAERRRIRNKMKAMENYENSVAFRDVNQEQSEHLNVQEGKESKTDTTPDDSPLKEESAAKNPERTMDYLESLAKARAEARKERKRIKQKMEQLKQHGSKNFVVAIDANDWQNSVTTLNTEGETPGSIFLTQGINETIGVDPTDTVQRQFEPMNNSTMVTGVEANNVKTKSRMLHKENSTPNQGSELTLQEAFHLRKPSSAKRMEHRNNDGLHENQYALEKSKRLEKQSTNTLSRTKLGNFSSEGRKISFQQKSVEGSDNTHVVDVPTTQTLTANKMLGKSLVQQVTESPTIASLEHKINSNDERTHNISSLYAPLEEEFNVLEASITTQPNQHGVASNNTTKGVCDVALVASEEKVVTFSHETGSETISDELKEISPVVYDEAKGNRIDVEVMKGVLPVVCDEPHTNELSNHMLYKFPSNSNKISPTIEENENSQAKLDAVLEMKELMEQFKEERKVFQHIIAEHEKKAAHDREVIEQLKQKNEVVTKSSSKNSLVKFVQKLSKGSSQKQAENVSMKKNELLQLTEQPNVHEGIVKSGRPKFGIKTAVCILQ